MGFFSYALKKKFTGDPKTLTQLRDQTMDKLAEYKAKGTYCFALETAADGDAAMVISWTDQAWTKGYGKLAIPKKPNELIFGNYVADQKKKTYDLSLESSDVAQSAFKKFMAEPEFAQKIWSLFTKDSMNQLKINGVVIPSPQYADQVIDTKAWNLTQVLSRAGQKDGSPLAAPALEGIEIPDGKAKVFVTKGGIRLAAEIPVQIKIAGQVAKLAKENPQTWAFVRDDVPEIFVAHATKLKDALLKLDAKPKKDPKEVDKLLTEFQDGFRTAVDEHVAERWLTLVEARVERRNYRLESALTVVKGVVTVGAGAASFVSSATAAAATGGVVGPAAILSFIGTVKTAVEFGAQIYTMFRGVEGMRKELDETLKVTIVSYAQKAGWKDLGKSALSKVPVFGPVIQAFGSKKGLAVKTAEQLEADVTQFGKKLATLIVNANDLGKDVNAIFDKQEEVMKALAADEKKYPKYKAGNDKKRAAIEKQVDALISKIAKMGEEFRNSEKYPKEFQTAIENLKKLQKAGFEESMVANFLNKYAIPLMEAPWGIDPSDLATTLYQTAGTIGDLARQASEDIDTLLKNPESNHRTPTKDEMDQLKSLKDYYDTGTTIKDLLKIKF